MWIFVGTSTNVRLHFENPFSLDWDKIQIILILRGKWSTDGQGWGEVLCHSKEETGNVSLGDYSRSQHVWLSPSQLRKAGSRVLKRYSSLYNRPTNLVDNERVKVSSHSTGSRYILVGPRVIIDGPRPWTVDRLHVWLESGSEPQWSLPCLPTGYGWEYLEYVYNYCPEVNVDKKKVRKYRYRSGGTSCMFK